jgi:hypothetical protein
MRKRVHDCRHTNVCHHIHAFQNWILNWCSI